MPGAYWPGSSLGRWIAAYPCERGGRLYKAKRTDKVWTDADKAAFLAQAPARLPLPLLMALWTGQRQGDLLRLPWAAYDGSTIRLTQSKTGTRVVVPASELLREVLDAMPRRAATIHANSEGSMWTSDGFRTSSRKAVIASGMTGLTFHDLRGTAMSRLTLAGCSEAEIATLTGHSLTNVRSILDSHCLNRAPALALAGIRELEILAELPNQSPNRPEQAWRIWENVV